MRFDCQYLDMSLHSRLCVRPGELLGRRREQSAFTMTGNVGIDLKLSQFSGAKSWGFSELTRKSVQSATSSTETFTLALGLTS